MMYCGNFSPLTTTRDSMTDSEWSATIPNEWKPAASSNDDERLRYNWHHQDGTVVEVWVTRLGQRDGSSVFSLRAATRGPDALIEYNAYEVERNETEAIGRRQADRLVQSLTTDLSGESNEETSLNLRLEDAISTFRRMTYPTLIGSLHEYLTLDNGT